MKYQREKISDPQNTHKKKNSDPRNNQEEKFCSYEGAMARDPRWNETHGI